MLTLRQNKGVHIEHETGKDIPTRGGKSSTGWVGCLSLGKKVFQPQDPFLTWLSRGGKMAGMRLAFPTKGDQDSCELNDDIGLESWYILEARV